MNTKLIERLIAVAMLAWTPWCLAQTRDCMVSGQQFAACATAVDAISSEGNQMTRTDRAYEAGSFDGFVLGVGLAEIQKTWCPQQVFTPNQLSAITSKFLRSSPELWGQNPTDLVRMALARAFPCARK